MKIILTADVKKVGQRGQVVDVADGYAQNVLLPKKQAVPATPENLKRIEKEALAAKGKKDMSAALAKKALAQIDGTTVEIHAKANESGVLFEAVREKHINDAFTRTFNISFPESAIKLPEPIKKTGTYSVPISVGGASAKISVTVAS